MCDRHSIARLIVSVSVASLVWAIASEAFAEESPTAMANPAAVDSMTAESTSSGEQHANDASPEEISAATGEAIEKIIVVLKQQGDAENLAQWELFRQEYPTKDPVACADAAAGWACHGSLQLRKQSNLRMASQLIPSALRLASAIKHQKPESFLWAHSEAELLDIEYERYQEAADDTLVALKFIKENNGDWGYALICLSNRALALRKLNKFDEAEDIYLKFLPAIEADPHVRKDWACDMRFALAALYVDKRDFQKYRETIPNGESQLYDINGELVVERAWTMGVASITCKMVSGQLDAAAEECQKLIQGAEHFYGVSSRKYFEATELLAEIRVAQSQYDDAMTLLKKSADIRAELLGGGHPSLDRVRQKIDSIQKL